MSYFEVQRRDREKGAWETMGYHRPNYERTLVRRRWLFFFYRMRSEISNKLSAELDAKHLAVQQARRIRSWPKHPYSRIIRVTKTRFCEQSYVIWANGRFLH